MLFTCGRVGNIRGVFIHGLPVWFRQVFSFQNLFLAMRLRVVDFFFLVNHALDDRSRDHEIFLLLMGSTSQSRSEQQDQPGFVQGGDPTGMTQQGGREQGQNVAMGSSCSMHCTFIPVECCSGTCCPTLHAVRELRLPSKHPSAGCSGCVSSLNAVGTCLL